MITRLLRILSLFIGFIFLICSQANAQTFNSNICGTEQQMEIMYKRDPKALLEREALRENVFQAQASPSSSRSYVIPVVVHVFGTEFNNGTTVTQAIVAEALQKTNEDFLGLTADYNTIDAPFDAIKQPLDITFKLAQLDPIGNPTTGVIFYDEASGMGNYDSPIVPRVAWDNYKYCNIYITRDLYDENYYTNSGVAWYPSTYMSNRNIARIVYNGSHLAGNTDENFRSVFTHEFGHYLDLPHTFDKRVCSDDPDEGDGVADTPSHKSSSGWTTCRVIHNCLGQEINNENFMDYTDCFKMFTQGQVARMKNALDNSPARNTLWTNANLQATGLSSQSQLVYVPDDKFEQKLIDLDFDAGALDDYVFTSNISTVTHLSLFNLGISDLTGIEKFTALTSLDCRNNQLTSLDVSANTTLTSLYCSSNQLTRLNVKNGNNINFGTGGFYAYGNPNLRCIQVDNAEWSTNNWTDIDGGATFSADCDSDNDGVFDDVDQCTTTPSGSIVDAIGCYAVKSSLNYCNTTVLENSEYISNISFAGVNHESVGFSADGYSNHTKLVAVVNAELSYGFSVTRSHEDANTQTEVWIDWNQDGDFGDANENVLSLQGVIRFGEINVPGSAHVSNGITRMRVRYGNSDEGLLQACGEDAFFGEVEDYSVLVAGGTDNVVLNINGVSPDAPSNVKFYPHPTVDLLHIAELESSDITVQVFSYNGQQVYNENHKSVNGIVQISMRGLSAGLYVVKVYGKQDGYNIRFKITKR